jgi:hypothetical protein
MTSDDEQTPKDELAEARYRRIPKYWDAEEAFRAHHGCDDALAFMLDASDEERPALIGELADEMRLRGARLENTYYGKLRLGTEPGDGTPTI